MKARLFSHNTKTFVFSHVDIYTNGAKVTVGKIAGALVAQIKVLSKLTSGHCVLHYHTHSFVLFFKSNFT